jgi:hypothetical protein
VQLEGLGKLKIHLIGTRTCDLPACSIVPQPTTLPRAPLPIITDKKMLEVTFVVTRCTIFESRIKNTVCCLEEGYCNLLDVKFTLKFSNTVLKCRYNSSVEY